METVICINLRNLPSSIRIEKNGQRYEHRATNSQRENCCIGWLLWTLNKSGQVMSDAYTVVTEGKFKKKISLFLIFSDNPRPGFDVGLIEHDLREILLDSSWRVQTQIDTTSLVEIVSLDSRKSPGTCEWVIGSDLEFHKAEDLVFSLAQLGRYQEAACLAKSTGLEKAAETIANGMCSSSDMGRV